MDRCSCVSLLVVVALVCAGAATPGCRSVREQSADETEADHDELVYSRYDRQVVCGVVEYDGFDHDYTELPRPATLEDVAEGRAVFSFEGLGPSRIWKLPECPISAKWVGLTQFPFEITRGEDGYYDRGLIVQAEELFVGGEWKRYFGFVCENGMAVAPADLFELYVSHDNELAFSDCEWGHQSSGIGCSWSRPYGIRNGYFVLEHITPGKLLPVDVFVGHSHGVPMKIKSDWYRGPDSGGPALVKGVALNVEFSPYANHPPGFDDYKPLKSKLKPNFAPTAAERTIDAGQTFKALTIDLADCFEISRPGHYRFQFAFDLAAMNLPDADPRRYESGFLEFSIGESPRRLKIREMNKKIPPFGGRVTEEQLRDLIVKTVKPPQASTRPSADHLLPASKLPPFTYDDDRGFSGSTGLFNPGEHSAVEPMIYSIWELLKTLDNYEPVGLLAELEQRMAATTDIDEKYLLAGLTASRGGKDAALFLLDGLKRTEPAHFLGALVALRQILWEHEEDPPDWVVRLILAAMWDRRYVLDSEYWLSVSSFSTVSDFACTYVRLASELAHGKCRKAVPYLIELCKETEHSDELVRALGDIGDPRAVPYLLQLCKDTKGAKAPVQALGRIGDPSAVPYLIQLCKDTKGADEPVSALGQIGDPRAVPYLIQLCRDTKGAHGPATALWCIGDQRAVPVLIDILKTGAKDERSVIWALGRLKSKKAVPVLIDRLKRHKTDAEDARENCVEYILGAMLSIGDKRVIEPIEEYLKTASRNGNNAAEARRVLVLLKASDPVGGLLGLLATETTRRAKTEIISTLAGYKEDERVVNNLADLVRTSASAYLRYEAIDGLESIGNRRSLLAMASLLDFKFPEGLKYQAVKANAKSFPQIIFERLKEHTKQDLGTDRAKWEAWIRKNVEIGK